MSLRDDRRPGGPASRLLEDWSGGPPPLTLAALAVICLFMALQVLDPAVLAALRRDPAGLAAGQWWRLASPVLVQADGWAQFAFNFAGIAVVGAAVERRRGRPFWSLAVLAGLAAGEWAGYRWVPQGAGSSVLVCGLAGGLLAFAWRRDLRDAWPLEFSFYWLTALAGDALLGPAGAAAACIGLALAIGGARARGAIGPRTVGAAILVMLAEAVLLCLLADDHGPPTLAGATVGLLLLRSTGSRPA